jgi:uncharacterized cofD-like protein
MKKVVVIGGGTGNFTVLSGLKNKEVELCAIVSMADDGGSTGILRDELGVLPPGDVRQCLIALSTSSRLMRSLMNYRFENGGLQGHNFGNILLSALEKVTGSFEKAVEEVAKILNIKGKVLPITTNKVRLNMVLSDDSILHGEREILLSKKPLIGFKSIYLEPIANADKHAINEIMNADLIVFGPGGLYTSLIPSLLVDGVSKALRDTEATKVLVVNLMNKKAHTPGFNASNYVNEVKKFVGDDVFDHILINNKQPPAKLMDKYATESEIVENDLTSDPRVIATDLIRETEEQYSPMDEIAATRAFIRHDPDKLAHELMNIVDNL